MNKRWWLNPVGTAVHGANRDGTEPMWDEKFGTEVQLAPVDAVVCERGSREWAVVMAMRGKRISIGYHKEVWFTRDILQSTLSDSWFELPALWVPERGEEVRWFRGKHYGTGTYDSGPEGSSSKCSICVLVDGMSLWVERVEKIEEEAK